MFFPFFSKFKSNQNKNTTKTEQDNDYLNMTKEIIKDESNNYCVECGEFEPKYISINNGVFLCKECILNHLQLSQESSTIIKNDLKILNPNEIKYIHNGGNKKLLDFINNEFPKLKEFPPQILYNTKAMDYYRKNLKFLTEGGNAPIKPSLDDALTIIEKPEESLEIDKEDPDINFDEYNQDNINKNIDNINDYNYEKNENDKTYHKNDNYVIKDNSFFKNKKNLIKIIDKEFNENQSNYYIFSNNDNNFSFSDYKKFTNFNKSQKTPKTIIIDELNYNNNNKYEKVKDNSDLGINKNIIKTYEYQKIIRFKNNYTNFDKENFYHKSPNTSKALDNYNKSNLKTLKDNKSKNNKFIRNGFLSPQTTLTHIKNTKSDNQLANNVYSKPKTGSILQKYKNRIKSDNLSPYVNNIDKNINDKIIISEFKIDDSKIGTIEKKDNKEDSNNNSNVKIKKVKNNIKNNKNYVIKKQKEEQDENKNKKETYIKRIDRIKLFQSSKILSKIESAKTLENCKNSKLSSNNSKIEKGREETSEGKKENKSNSHISVNIAQFNIIKNIKNYNINLYDSKKEKNEKKKIETIITKIEFNSNKKKEKKNSDNNNSEKIIPNIVSIPTLIEKSKTNREEIKAFKKELKKENSQTYINKRLSEFRRNIYKNEDENETKNNNKNTTRNCQTINMSNSINSEKDNFKYKQKLNRNKDSNEKKSYSFYSLREKYKSKEKEQKEKGKEKEKEKNNINQKDNILNEKNKEIIINESIRNKYKKKKLNFNHS